MNSNLWQSLSVLFYVGVQVFLLRHVSLFDTAYPFVYVAFLLFLPLQTNHSLLMVIGFVVGLVVDSFYDTIGMHAAACVLLTALRPMVLSLTKPTGGYENIKVPSLFNLGFRWFLSYSIILVPLHHVMLFMLHSGTGAIWLTTLSKALLSSAFTIVCTFIVQFVFYREK
jgi:rod shape-determining protein MreD